MRRLDRFIHLQPDWPSFDWDRRRVGALTAQIRYRQGRLTGRIRALGLPLREEAVLETLTEDVVKSSEIEGERLIAAEVRSSLARRLGMELRDSRRIHGNVEAVVEMMLDGTANYGASLSAKRLFAWHASLFPSGRSGMRSIRVGGWRASGSPMQVVSGAVGREKVHFEAPAAVRLNKEMQAFLAWFNKNEPNGSKLNENIGVDWVEGAALAHLWFVTVHPFDDGNGRIARAISDMALARAEGSPQRFYSMSAQILRERSAYYEMLESTQRGTMEITPWMEWFLSCLGRAINAADHTVAGVLAKARFWKAVSGIALNPRQRLLLQRLLDGFVGKLTTSKWAKLAKCSHDTALRDISDLVERGVLLRNKEGGRSTSYALAPLQGNDE